MKTYEITVCAMVDGIPGHTIVEIADETGTAIHHFPTLQKAEAFSFFLLGLGYHRIP
jgi:hypothetical protein